MSGLNYGQRVAAVIDGVNDACTVEAGDAPAAVFWLDTASGLSGLTLVPEGSFDGTNWFTLGMHVSNQTTSAPIVVSATLAAVPAYFFHVPAQGCNYVRLRASAIAGGSVNLNGVATTDPSLPR